MQLKKVLLVTVPYHSGVVESAGTWMNLAFVYIAGSLRKFGFDPYILDAMSLFIDHDAIQKEIADLKPDVVATSAFTAGVPDAIELLKRAKEVDERIVTIAGNVHPTFMPKEMFEQSGGGMDYIIRHEGEYAMPELLSCINNDGDLEDVPGVSFIRDGALVSTPDRPYVQNLDELELAWDLVNWKDYTYKTKPGSTLAIASSSRGCEQKCEFCSQQLFWKQTWRSRSAENFVDELTMLREKYDVDVTMIPDETPTFDEERWKKILTILKERKLGMDLLLETRVDDILRDEAIMDLYADAGVQHIYVGIEAVSQDKLDTFGKDVTVEASKKALNIINDAGIISETSFVLGMPDETPESMRQTVQAAIDYAPDMAFFLAIAPWPYSPLYEKVKDYIVDRNYRNYNLVEPVLKPENMTIDELKTELMEANKTFYMDKVQNLDRLSPYKQKYMKDVIRLLINDSYIGKEMAEMLGNGKDIPTEMKEMVAKLM